MVGIAGSHLYVGAFISSGGYSFIFSAAGTFLVGFWAWKYWYGAALLVGLGLAFGGLKIKRYAAGALFILCLWLLLWALLNVPFTVPVFASTTAFLSGRFWRELVATADVPVHPDESHEPPAEKPDDAT